GRDPVGGDDRAGAGAGDEDAGRTGARHRVAGQLVAGRARRRPAEDADAGEPAADGVVRDDVLVRTVDRDADPAVVADDVVVDVVEAGRADPAAAPVVDHDPVPAVALADVVPDDVVEAEAGEDDPV